jgi:hypothetical protein
MKINKLIIVSCVVAGLGLIGYSMLKKGGVAKKPVSLTDSLKDVLPVEAREKLLVNQDKINVGKQYISTIHITQDDSKAGETIAQFIYKAFQRLDSDEMKNITAVNIVIYKDHEDKTKARQYRVLIGTNVAKKQDKNFWESEDKVALFKWLTKECPLTDPRNLTDFCDISSSLKEQ